MVPAAVAAGTDARPKASVTAATAAGTFGPFSGSVCRDENHIVLDTVKKTNKPKVHDNITSPIHVHVKFILNICGPK